MKTGREDSRAYFRTKTEFGFLQGELMQASELRSDIIDNLRKIFQVLHEYSKEVERSCGLTGAQLWAIKILNEGNPLRVSDLARRMYLHPATVVGIIDRLHNQGLVQRTRSKKDRREVIIQLTPQGEILVDSSPEVAQGLLAVGLENSNYNQLVEINKSLKRLVSIFGLNGTLPRLILSDQVSLPIAPQKRKKAKDPKLSKSLE